MSTPNPAEIHLKDYCPPDFLIDQVALTFELGEQETRVHSRLHLRRNPNAKGRTADLYLHGEQLALRSIQLDGSPLGEADYLQDDESLTIKQVPDLFELEIEVVIKPQENTALEGLYKSGSMFCTQCEAEGFRKITYYQDRPDVMARFKTTIIADPARYPVLLSNGNPLSKQILEDGRLHICWEDPFPKPSYLFALVAGDLCKIEDSYTTHSGREVALEIFVEAENVDKCDHAMRSLKKAMAWDERQYGREYDLDIYMIVAVNDFNMGAMENKGLNVFNSKFVLARPDTATDRDFQGIEAVIAHEYFHNWTGNRITCRDWFQLSLKEGLTVFRDQEFSADMGNRGVKRIEDVRLLRSHQFAEDSSSMAHPIRPASYIEINNFYTVTIYEKGAEVVRMQHSLLGAEGYRKATDLYFERHDGQAVTTEDFVQCMEDASGRDLAQFKRWYDYAGTPELAISSEYDAAQKCFSLKIIQSCPDTAEKRDKPAYHMPLAIGLIDPDGNEIANQMLELTERESHFSFNGIEQKPVPSLLRGFTAPVKVSYDYSDDELMFLMRHDSDEFNRWEVAQTLAQRIILGMVDNGLSALPQGFVDAIRAVLQDGESDKALLAEVLAMPSESYLGDQMAVVDVEGIHKAVEHVRSELARALKEPLLALYNENQEEGGFDIEQSSIARRALKNCCLGYLMQHDDADIQQRCFEQFSSATNMTDVMAALTLLSHQACDQRELALAAFEKQWADDPLVMDKWFAVQAISKRPEALDEVIKLMEHPAFSIKNPNKVRSLIGAFCSANLTGFHTADGRGYRFLADRVLELDRLNPQVASRMLRLMSRWQRYDASRQQLMKGELERILATEGLSKDSYEIASKSLQQQ
ncbi:MAG: aminopeptidase N [Candidatus Polarisedimenticolaceae bacterium]|nr:aminopeptidase N [Candidatus Polarisedimenticolaceae bacterium]